MKMGGVLRRFLFLFLFAAALIVGLAWWKKSPDSTVEKPIEEKVLAPLPPPVAIKPVVPPSSSLPPVTAAPLPAPKPPPPSPSVTSTKPLPSNTAPSSSTAIPQVDRVDELFNTGLPKLEALVQTITYTKNVEWLQGRAAWLGDYATYYATSKHFIARSLNRGPNYMKQDVREGDRFNVYRKDKRIAFHLVVALDRCKLLLYAIDINAGERYLLKTYDVGVGRKDLKTPSGSLTPLGLYSLGKRVATYQPGVIDVFQHQETEMVRIFGTRWIPFDREIKNCTAISKGLGLHGAPWVLDAKSGQWSEELTSIGKYSSDGCVRLSMRDIEEIYAIIISQPAVVEIVATFADCQLPGKER